MADTRSMRVLDVGRVYACVEPWWRIEMVRVSLWASLAVAEAAMVNWSRDGLTQ